MVLVESTHKSFEKGWANPRYKEQNDPKTLYCNFVVLRFVGPSGFVACFFMVHDEKLENSPVAR